MMGQIIIAGVPVEVPFPTRQRLGELPGRPRRGEVVQAILHHDGCLSADACIRVLLARKLSTHFIIDNDGTCVQCADPALFETWHAVGRVKGTSVLAGFNRRSIGIDISNAVLPKYAGKYHPPREVVRSKVHGRDYTGLVPYPVQVETVLALLRVLRLHFPMLSNAHRDEADWIGDLTGKTPGMWGHVQISPMKVDPFGFPFERLRET